MDPGDNSRPSSPISWLVSLSPQIQMQIVVLKILLEGSPIPQFGEKSDVISLAESLSDLVYFSSSHCSRLSNKTFLQEIPALADDIEMRSLAESSVSIVSNSSYLSTISKAICGVEPKFFKESLPGVDIVKHKGDTNPAQSAGSHGSPIPMLTSETLADAFDAFDIRDTPRKPKVRSLLFLI